MPGLLGGLEGVAAGAPGGPLGMALGGLTGLFGGSGKPREDPITQQSRQLALQAQQRQMQFANSVPGSDPSELAQLSQERGALGAAQRNAQQNIAGAWNPQMGTNSLSDMLKNIQSSFTGQQMSLEESHLQNALSARRQALTEAANSGGRVSGPTYQPQSDLPQLLGSIAHSLAYNQNKNKGGAAGAAGAGGGTGGGSGMPNTSTGGYGTYTGSNTNFPDPNAGTNALMGGLPQPLYNQPGGPMDTTLQMPQQMQGTGAQPVNAQGGGYNIDGQATLQNQIQRSFSPWLRLG